MSPFIIFLFIFILYLCSKPRLRRYVERDGLYLSRKWTSFVNAFFITLVVCSHGLILFRTSICDYFPEKCVATAIAQFGQIMVTTFFFYSGYGIAYSLLNRERYYNKLIFPRFIQLSLYFVMAVLVYFIVHCILQKEIHIQDFLQGLHDFQTLGNPSWFILMTLLAYILTYICFKVFGTRHPATTIGVLTILLVIAMHFVNLIKPIHWINTMLCFPAGMLYYMKGEQFEKIIKKQKIPGIICAILLLVLGMLIYRSGISPSLYVQNAGCIIFAVGVTWFAGSFTWQTPSRFLIWLGGSGLFTVYMYHLLPMRFLTKMELNLAPPYLVWLVVVATTGILATTASIAHNKINNHFFRKQ